jgi:hypothetical protein
VQGWALTPVAKACANTAHLLARALPKGNPLLPCGRYSAGELGFVVAQGILVGRNGKEILLAVPQEMRHQGRREVVEL